jgi:hypothetical protein
MNQGTSQKKNFRHDHSKGCGLFLFPNSTQEETLGKINRQYYLKLPKPGTNLRGVEISAKALNILSSHP